MLMKRRNRSNRWNHRVAEIATTLRSEDRGSFSVEASVVFPVVLLASLALIFFSLYIYEKGLLYHVAAVTADRAAYTWDNTHKDPVTGAFSASEQDGLYWRTFEDNVSGIFSFFTGDGVVGIQLPEDAGRTDLDTPRKKLMNAASLLPPVEKAELTYAHGFFDRVIRVRLENPFRMPDFLRQWLYADRVREQAEARAVDPVEFIRLIDFTKLYAGEFKGRISKQDAEKLLVEPEAQRAPDSFQGHDLDAAPYLRQLVGGKADDLPSVGSSTRHIDALDKSGVAHQAFCTYTKSNLLSEQMPKDVYLLQKGAVKGVVWHFFTNCRGKQPKPSAALQSELQKNGIVVVIHD